MGLLRRILGAVVLLLSGVGIILCVGGIVGAWVVRHEASEKVRRIFNRVDAGLLRLSAASDSVQRAVATARADVAGVRTESAGLTEGGAKSRMAASAVR